MSIKEFIDLMAVAYVFHELQFRGKDIAHHTLNELDPFNPGHPQRYLDQCSSLLFVSLKLNILNNVMPKNIFFFYSFPVFSYFMASTCLNLFSLM